MTIQSSGAISLADIAGEFGGSTPHSLNEYYKGGALVDAAATNDPGGIPTSGTIDFNDFYGAAANAFRIVGNTALGQTAAATDAAVSVGAGINNYFTIWSMNSSPVLYPTAPPYVGYSYGEGGVDDGNTFRLWGFSTITEAQNYAAALNGDTLEELVVNGTVVTPSSLTWQAFSQYPGNLGPGTHGVLLLMSQQLTGNIPGPAPGVCYAKLSP